MSETLYEGGCHCQAVRFRVRTEVREAILCNCSICRMKGIVHHFVPRERFELLSGEKNLTDYQFNTRAAHHYFCKTCGIHSYYIPRSHPDQYDVNLRCLKGLDWEKLPIRNFDGKNWEEAIAALRKKGE